MTEDNWWRPSIVLFFQLSGWIGVPIILGLYLGKWLDEKFQTEPWLFLTTIGAAFIISLVGMIRESKKAIKKFTNSEKQHNTDE